MRPGYNYTLENGVLSKPVKRNHLIWKLGGVPAIDARIWEKYKHAIKYIACYAETGKYIIPADIFDEQKIVVNWGYGEQVTAPKTAWTITETKPAAHSKAQARSVEALF